jgi:hypothetical protein
VGGRFFFRNGITPASASVDAHSHLLIKIIQKFTTQGSSRVDTNISHRKNREKLSELGILQSSNRPPSSLVENILGNHSKAVASRNHALPLILREQETPELDPVNHSVDNL